MPHKVNPQLWDGKDGVMINASAVAVALGYANPICVTNLARRWGLGQKIGNMIFYTGAEVRFIKTRRGQIGQIPKNARVAIERSLGVDSEESSEEPAVGGNPR